MKVVCVGCSFTNGPSGSGIAGTYPHHIKSFFKSATVYNLGIGGSSNIMSNIILEKAIEEIVPDFVVRQVTLKERFMMLQDKNSFTINENIIKLEDNYYLLNDNNIRKHVAYWSSSKIYYTGLEYSIKDLEKIQKFFYKNFSDAMIQELHESILSKTEVLLKNIPHVIFSWRKLDSTGKYKSVEEMVGFERENLSDLAGHFNTIGNKKIFDNIIKPEMEKYV